MKKVSIVTLICVVAAFSIVAYAYFHLARKGAGSALAQPLKSKDELPKGAYVYRERKLVTEGDAWDYTVYLPPELYSKETIERCFQWYAKKYPDEMTDLYMEIFTNKDTMEFYMTHIFTDGGGITEQLGATYFRSHLVGSHGEINEYYSYSPENNYRHYKNGYGVMLRGCPDFLPEVIKKWSRHFGKVEMQVSCVISKSSPSKYYYQLYCNNYLDGTAVLSMYNPDPNLKPENNLYSLGDGKLYFFFGWKYAISLDDGKTWDVWSADRKLSDFKSGEYNLIKKVEIDQSGKGKMELTRSQQEAGVITTLFTKDYGIHWEAQNAP